jgi:PAS domain S-box-containing protein
MNNLNDGLELDLEKFKSAFMSIPIPCYIWKRKENKFYLVSYNKALNHLSKGEIKSYLGMELSQIFNDDSMISMDINNCYNNKLNYCKEMRYNLGNHIKNRIFIATFDFISPDLVVVFTEDITKQKKIENTLRKEEKEKSIILESISEHIVYQDLKNKILWTNKAAADSVDLKIHNLIGKKCYEIWPKRDSPCIRCPIIEAVKTRKPTSEEMSTPDGRIWSIKGYPVFDAKENVVAAVEITKEITQIKKAEENLKKTQLKYQELFDNSPYSIFLIDINGILVDCNAATKNILSYHTIDDMIGKHFTDVLSLNEGNIYLIPQFKKIIQKVISGEEVKDFIFLISRTAAKKIWVSASVSLIKIVQERLIQFIIKDITENKETEEKLKESELKFRESFNRTKFYKDIFAHDINNILQNISSAIDLLNIKVEEITVPEECEELLSIIKDQVIRGTNLVSNVRTLSDVEDLSFSIEEINALGVLKDVKNFLIKSYHDKNVEIMINTPYDEIKVYANQLLSDLFENILINAIRYNRNHSIQIIINISKRKNEDNNFIKLEFIDNGIGIPDTMKEKIFQRGYNAKEFVSGLGLGLTLVKKILNLYKGEIWVQDKIEGDYTQGSNFVILIPEVMANG